MYKKLLALILTILMIASSQSTMCLAEDSRQTALNIRKEGNWIYLTEKGIFNGKLYNVATVIGYRCNNCTENETEVKCTHAQGDIAIPEKITPKSIVVTRIAENLFAENKFITSVTIPHTVEEIGVKEVKITKKNIEEIENNKEFTYTIEKIREEIANENKETKVNNNVIYQINDALEKDEITDNLLGKKNNGAFQGCTSLKEIIFAVDEEGKSNLHSIGSNSFYDCDLRTVTLPDSIKNIYGGAFAKNENLEEVRIGEGIETVLPENKNFNKYYLPFKNTNIKKVVVSENFKDVHLKEHFPKAEIIEGGNYYTDENDVIYSEDKTTLIACPSNKIIDKYNIYESTTDIVVNAFSNSQVNSITLPKTLTNVKSDAFYNCPIKEFNMQDSGETSGVYSVENNALIKNNPSSRTLVKYPEGSTNERYKIPEDIVEIEANAIISNYLKEITIPKSVTTIGSNAIGYQRNIEDNEEIIENYDLIIKANCDSFARIYENVYNFIDVCDKHFMLGDINGDKKISVADARKIVVAIAKNKNSYLAMPAGDYNDDSKITVADARKLIVGIANGGFSQE